MLRREGVCILIAASQSVTADAALETVHVCLPAIQRSINCNNYVNSSVYDTYRVSILLPPSVDSFAGGSRNSFGTLFL